jgi:hypothetical protein
MTRGLLVAVVFTLLFDMPVFAGTELAVGMTNGCSASDTILEIAKNEALQIWARADVNVQWMNPADLPYTSPKSEWLVVQCITGYSPMLRSAASHLLPIAAIRFIDSRPINAMLVSLDNAKLLLERDVQDSRGLGERFQYLKELRLGRILGRAIAHEIGHFVGASTTHTQQGLMRASHTVPDLIGKSLSPFRVDRVLAPQLTKRNAVEGVPVDQKERRQGVPVDADGAPHRGLEEAPCSR